MRRGLWPQMLVISVIVTGLQVASLALTCVEHWTLTTQHHHSVPAADHSSHSHTDGTLHTHEQCSFQGAPAPVLLLVPGLDCLGDTSNCLALLHVHPTERLALLDDSYPERTLLELSSRPPIL